MKYRWCVILAALLFTGGAAWADEPKGAETARTETAQRESAAAEKMPETAAPVKKADAVLEKEMEPAKAPVEKPAEETLPPIRKEPLSEEDFSLRAGSEYRLGDPFGKLLAEKGEAKRRVTGPVHDEYEWDGFSVSVLKEMPERYLRRKISKSVGEGPWGSAYYLSEKGASAAGISVGDSRETLLRTLGAPSRFLWDGRQQCFYALYTLGDECLTFTVKENKIAGIRMAYAEAVNAETGVAAEANARFKEKDFRVAGYALDDIFKEHPWMVWEKKAVNAAEEIWYYTGFSVRMDAKSKQIGSLSVTDPRMLTARGISVGDHRTTLEAFYGEPEKVEMNELEGAKQVVYIYFSRDQKQVILFYIDAKKETVTHIVVMKNPLAPSVFKPLAEKITQVREKNAAEAR